MVFIIISIFAPYNIKNVSLNVLVISSYILSILILSMIISSMLIDIFPLKRKLRNHGYVFGYRAAEKYLVAYYATLWQFVRNLI